MLSALEALFNQQKKNTSMLKKRTAVCLQLLGNNLNKFLNIHQNKNKKKRQQLALASSRPAWNHPGPALAGRKRRDIGSLRLFWEPDGGSGIQS